MFMTFIHIYVIYYQHILGDISYVSVVLSSA